MTPVRRLTLKFVAFLALAAIAVSSPPVAQAEDQGWCGVCSYQNVPCGGSQEAMNTSCQSLCGRQVGINCSQNGCGIFVDGWWCVNPPQ
jgi:hypothetical protein